MTGNIYYDFMSYYLWINLTKQEILNFDYQIWNQSPQFCSKARDGDFQGSKLHTCRIDLGHISAIYILVSTLAVFEFCLPQ